VASSDVSDLSVAIIPGKQRCDAVFAEKIFSGY
jgi:hypothetical protein